MEIVVQSPGREIVVRRNDIVVQNASRVISIVPSGARGATGATGAPGSSFLFTQATPLASWVINHNLGFRPNVSATGADGNIVVGNVIHFDDNQCEIQFKTPQTGTARCS